MKPLENEEGDSTGGSYSVGKTTARFTNLNPLKAMYSPDLSMGLGSLVYALSKLDGRLQTEEMKTAKELLADEPNSELALYAFFLRENVNETVEEAYAFGMRRLFFNRTELDVTIKKRFVDVLIRVAQSHNDISQKEQAFIQQFRREIRRL